MPILSLEKYPPETMKSSVFRTKELYYPEHLGKEHNNQINLSSHVNASQQTPLERSYSSRYYIEDNSRFYTNTNTTLPSSSFKPIETVDMRNPDFFSRYDQNPSMGVYGSGGESFHVSFASGRNEGQNLPFIPPIAPSTLSISWQSSSYPEYYPHQESFQEPMKSSQNINTQLTYTTIDVQPLDVLCGRGGATNSHSGNADFRSIVERYKLEYLNAKKINKPAVAGKIVEIIRKKGGHFLRKQMLPNSSDPVTDANGNVVWYDIGDEKAREKTCQALREGAPEIRRRSDDRKEDISDVEDPNSNNWVPRGGYREKADRKNLSKPQAVVSSPSIATRSSSSASSVTYITPEVKITSPELSGHVVTKNFLARRNSTKDCIEYYESPPRKLRKTSTSLLRYGNMVDNHDMVNSLDIYDHAHRGIPHFRLPFKLSIGQCDPLVQSFAPPSSTIRRKDADEREIQPNTSRNF
jgi:hypothetical protein